MHEKLSHVELERKWVAASTIAKGAMVIRRC